MFYKSYYTFTQLFTIYPKWALAEFFQPSLFFINFASIFKNCRVSSQNREDGRFWVKVIGKKKLEVLYWKQLITLPFCSNATYLLWKAILLTNSMTFFWDTGRCAVTEGILLGG